MTPLQISDFRFVCEECDESGRAGECTHILVPINVLPQWSSSRKRKQIHKLMSDSSTFSSTCTKKAKDQAFIWKIPVTNEATCLPVDQVIIMIREEHHSHLIPSTIVSTLGNPCDMTIVLANSQFVHDSSQMDRFVKNHIAKLLEMPWICEKRFTIIIEDNFGLEASFLQDRILCEDPDKSIIPQEKLANCEIKKLRVTRAMYRQGQEFLDKMLEMDTIKITKKATWFLNDVDELSKTLCLNAIANRTFLPPIESKI